MDQQNLPPAADEPPRPSSAPGAGPSPGPEPGGAAAPTLGRPDTGFPPGASPAFEPPRRPFPWAPFLGGTAFGCGCLPWISLFLFSMIMGTMFSGPRSSSGPRSDSVGLVDVSGIITSGSPGDGGIFGAGGAEARDIVDQLERARKSDRIKAVVLYINSPGGSAAGSDVVYREIQKVRADGLPVVVAMGDVAASGGYYIASAADRIFANGATVTGSIGVITQLPNFSDPNGWISKSGYDQIVIKSGPFKDMGNPFRPMRPDEKALFQQMVNDIYNQFLGAVSTARKMPMARLKPLADGRVFTGRQAVKNGLVDEIGGLEQAVAYAGQKAGLGSDPKVYRLGGSPLERLLGDTSAVSRALSRGRGLGLMLLDPRAEALSRGLGGGAMETEIP